MKVKINQNHNKPSKSDIYIKYYISILYNQTASKSILRKPIYRFPERKPCRIIVLNNNVPQISLYYQPSKKDSTIDISKQDWEVSYNLGNSWNKVKRNKKKNSSLYKVDINISGIITKKSGNNANLSSTFQFITRHRSLFMERDEIHRSNGDSGIQ